MKFSHAPRDRIRFVAEIEKLILRILGHPEALVSDESLLSDFCLFDSDRAARPGHLPEVFQFIATNMPEDRRRWFFGNENACRWEKDRIAFALTDTVFLD